MEEPTTFEEQAQPNRLKTLWTLTFINSGFAIFAFILTMVSIKRTLAFIKENYDTVTANMSDAQTKQLQLIMDMGGNKIIIGCGVLLLIIGLSLSGAIQMWQGKYRGFIIYAVANLMLLISNLISFNLVFAAIDILFIVLYYKQSKFLKI